MINKKILFLIIFNILNFAHSYPNEGLPALNNEALNKIKPEVVYYENNKWNFIEKEIVNKINKTAESYIGEIFTAWTICLGLSWFAAGKIYAKNNKNDIRLLIALAFEISAIIALICKLLELEITKINVLKVLDDFFKNYSTDTNSTLEVNYRRFVPQELLATFDAIYEIYKRDGTNSLKTFTNIFNDIRNQFVTRREQYITA